MPEPGGSRSSAGHKSSPCRSSVISQRRGWRRAMALLIAAAMDGASPGGRLAEVRARIAKAARTSGREPGEVTLVAVSKTHGPDAIRPLLAAGQRAFGENRVQEAQAKWPALKAEAPDAQLHLIGSLQSNKAEEAVALFDVIHSVDRLSLVEALAKAMAKAGRRPG